MIAELRDLVYNVCRYYPNLPRENMRFAVIHSGERILPELGPALGDYARAKLEARGVAVILGRRLASATAQSVILYNGDEIATDTFVWTAGNQPNPILEQLPCEKVRGQVSVDATLKVKGLENVWAVGDCAQIPDPAEEGRAYPPTGQHALREGKHLAENLAAVFSGWPTKSFSFKAISSLVGLGHRTAAAEIHGHRFSGLLAWLMWRTIYLRKLPGMERKMRVSLDWLLDLVFPRDIALTSRPRPQPRSA